MPRIVDIKYYNGAERRIQRLGLAHLLAEIQTALTQFELRLAERRHANGAASIREVLDRRFGELSGWKLAKSGAIDWTKCVRNDGVEACVGMELQISARSDLLTNDLTHLMAAIEAGDIDVGIIVVPCDQTAVYLTDRCPRFSDALEHVERAKAQFSPLVIMSIGHDGLGDPLPKRRTNLGKRKSGKASKRPRVAN